MQNCSLENIPFKNINVIVGWPKNAVDDFYTLIGYNNIKGVGALSHVEGNRIIEE